MGLEPSCFFQGCGPVIYGPRCVCVIYGLIDLGFDYRQTIDQVGAYPAPTLVHIQPGWGTISATDPTHIGTAPPPLSPTSSISTSHRLTLPLLGGDAISLSLSQIGTSASKVNPLSFSPHSRHSRSADCLPTELYHSSSLGA